MTMILHGRHHGEGRVRALGIGHVIVLCDVEAD